MKLEDPSTTPQLFALARASVGPATAGLKPAGGARAFSEVLAESRQAPVRSVASGDTLLGIVRAEASQRGVQLSASEALRQAHQLARDSAISDPGRIFPGQRLNLSSLHARLEGLRAAPASPPAVASQSAAQVLGRAPNRPEASPTAASNQGRQALATYAALHAQGRPQVPAASAAPAAQAVAFRPAPARAAEVAAAGRPVTAGPHPVLDKTLDRAVARGFIPAAERGDVYDKILQLAARHQFRPDDFARMTLMESDGMNPRATNERCHGIIQFCDGSDRGAATAGFAENPRAILGFSVYQQLHLVDRYFSEVGAKPPGAPAGPASLDDLYLAVLMPSARSSQEPHAPLNVPGTQARYLHVGGDRAAPITRQSILTGLQQNASERLAAFGQRLRPQAQREDAIPVAMVSPRIR